MVQNDATVLTWDGKPRAMKIWEKDLTLKQAFHLSCVPCYQEIARKVGAERMQQYGEKFNYGDLDITAENIDRFWLEGNSKISQFQQIDFLKRFHRDSLPISAQTSKTMKRMMVMETHSDYLLRGKTGWAARANNNNGWFVGNIESAGNTYFFATNIEPKLGFDRASFLSARKKVTMKAFRLLQSDKRKQYDKDYVKQAVSKIADIFEQNYVFPEKGKAIKEMLLLNLEEGKYSDLNNLDSLGVHLKHDMIALANDKHIGVHRLLQHDTKEPIGDIFDQFENYGFTKSEILEGNIGYLKVDIFYPYQQSAEAGVTAQRIMQSFDKCKAIIFDLRESRGGDPSMLNLLVTYLYPEGSKIHLNDFYYRPSNDTTSSYTLDKVKGRRFVNEKVYVLTSNKTFSAAEEFAYDLKHLGRATIIGETTGGGAHPVFSMALDNNFELSVPVGRAINPITNTNWEGVGVIPHIKTKQEEALDEAINRIER